MNRLFSAIGAFALLVTMLASSASSVGAQDGSQDAGPGTQDYATWKCGMLREMFPQTTEGVQELGASLAGVEKSRINTHEYRCSTKDATAVFDGFTVLGPNEGFSGDVTLTVPEYGAIDGSRPECGFAYTGETTIEGDLPEDCDDTIRAHDGTVTGPRLTFYPIDDSQAQEIPDDYTLDMEAAPSDEESDKLASETCMTGVDMAEKMDWDVLQEETVAVNDKDSGYGAVVRIKEETIVPDGWILQGDGPGLHGNGEDLATPGFYTAYPPEGACRKTLEEAAA